MKNWALSNPPMAWSPKGAALAVAIKPGERTMTWETWLQRMGSRIRWMCDQQDDGPAELERLWAEKAGADLWVNQKAPEECVHHPMFLDAMTQQHGLSRSMFPMPCQNQPAMAEAMDELSSLFDWVQQAAER